MSDPISGYSDPLSRTDASALGGTADTQPTGEVARADRLTRTHSQDRIGRLDARQEPVSGRQGPDLPPPAQPGAETLRAAAEGLERLSGTGMQDVFEIMAEFFRISQSLREVSKQAAHAELERQVGEIENQAKDMHSAAVWSLVAGIVSGIAQIGAGAFQTYGAAKSISTLGGGGEAGATKAMADAMSMRWSGLSGIVSGGGKGIESGFQYLAAMDQEAVKRDEAAATRAAGERDEMLKFKEGMEENMRAALQALQQVMQSREQVVSKIFA
ncbi:type III secretion system translocon subunit SctB [Imhoffiella purpurea]|uniref:Uncharacterized protein n=1 Tax=Imhoffiella purpurea TaxID=1249627 RepID=W9V7U8_9GAMM|nr:type III secretion system translocon subunit SctB [Imhoffiella purpurea]EXJ15658.1 hypothetical protein D779_1165 [Imhoffiella purpurea]